MAKLTLPLTVFMRAKRIPMKRMAIALRATPINAFLFYEIGIPRLEERQQYASDHRRLR